MADSQSTGTTQAAKKTAKKTSGKKTTNKKTTSKKTARKSTRKASARKTTEARKSTARASSAGKITAPAKAPMPAPNRPAPASSHRAADVAPGSRSGISADERQRMVAEAAYYRALNRGFHGGNPAEDWREAEAEIDALLSGAVASE